MNPEPRITVHFASESDKHVILELMQGYFSELEQFTPIGRNENGAYDYVYLDAYWQEPTTRFPFLIRANDDVAGFTLVNTYSRLGHTNLHNIAEFYIKPDHRRTAVGTMAAILVFGQFPGNWELAVLEQNQPAQRFWEHVINRISSTPVRVDRTAWKGPVYSFSVDANCEGSPD